MLQSVSLVTLGVADLSVSSRFYRDGFGWTSVWENDEIVFYQMNGLVLATFLRPALEADMNRAATGDGAIALVHNVRTEAEVAVLIDALVVAGGTVLRPADNPPHGGRRGYVADPDGHAWEIAWQPAFTIADDGRVTFGA